LVNPQGRRIKRRRFNDLLLLLLSHSMIASSIFVSRLLPETEVSGRSFSAMGSAKASVDSRWRPSNKTERERERVLVGQHHQQEMEEDDDAQSHDENQRRRKQRIDGKTTAAAQQCREMGLEREEE
jgi:hypothetical protein